MIRRHSVVLNKPNGAVELYPMKQWLRENPDHLPEGLHPDTNTSHSLRSALRQAGWRMEVHSDQVLLIPPDSDADTTGIVDLMPDSSEEEVIEAEEITFGLERDLQNALRANIGQLEPGLSIIDDGRERTTEAGRIDITARDQAGTIVVIELKAGIAKPEAVAQVLAYMGSIAGEAGQTPVRGILVAGDFHKRVILAARAIPNLSLKKYSFQFRFDTID